MSEKEQINKTRREHYQKHKEQINKTRNIWRAKNAKVLNEKRKTWYNKNKEHMTEWRKKYYMKNKEKINKRNKETYYKNQEKYCLQHREYNKSLRKQQKEIVINHYTNGKNCCDLCGITNLVVLTVDHINGNGNKHRSTLKGQHIHAWLIKNNFPDGYRILCFNCQNMEKERKYQYAPANKIF